MKCMELVALCEYDDQFVPTLTPCSAASLRLKNMRLPRMQRSMGFPRTLMMFNATALVVLNRSATMANTMTKIALFINE